VPFIRIFKLRPPHSEKSGVSTEGAHGKSSAVPRPIKLYILALSLFTYERLIFLKNVVDLHYLISRFLIFNTVCVDYLIPNITHFHLLDM